MLKASIDQTRAQETRAEIELKRSQKLVKQSAAAQKEVDRWIADLNGARAAIRSLEAQLRRAAMLRQQTDARADGARLPSHPDTDRAQDCSRIKFEIALGGKSVLTVVEFYYDKQELFLLNFPTLFVFYTMDHRRWKSSPAMLGLPEISTLLRGKTVADCVQFMDQIGRIDHGNDDNQPTLRRP